MEGTLGSCIQTQRLLWAGSQGNLTKATRAQLPAAEYRNWRPSLPQTEKLLSKLCYYYLIKQKNFLALTFFFLLNNWPPFCRKTNKQTNPYRQVHSSTFLKDQLSAYPVLVCFNTIFWNPHNTSKKKPTQPTKHKIPATKKLRQKKSPLSKLTKNQIKTTTKSKHLCRISIYI